MASYSDIDRWVESARRQQNEQTRAQNEEIARQMLKGWKPHWALIWTLRLCLLGVVALFLGFVAYCFKV